MKLQLALDFSDMNENLRVLEETADLVDIIEYGTGALIPNGYAGLKALRERYPEKTILCDQKIMDGGYIFTEQQAECGADIVTVLAAAEDETIMLAVKAAREKKIKVMADLCGVKESLKRAEEIKKLGVDYICVHMATDGSHEKSGVPVLQKISDRLGNKICAIAGSVTPEKCREIKKLEPGIVIVGSYITKAENCRKAAEQIRNALK